MLFSFHAALKYWMEDATISKLNPGVAILNALQLLLSGCYRDVLSQYTVQYVSGNPVLSYFVMFCFLGKHKVTMSTKIMSYFCWSNIAKFALNC
jgi:hypothetical protein